MMRYLLTICFLFTLSVSSPAQKTDTDSTKLLTLKELELSNEQLMAIKKLVVEYKSEERIKRSELRNKILNILNVRQQWLVRSYWRRFHRNVTLFHR